MRIEKQYLAQPQNTVSEVITSKFDAYITSSNGELTKEQAKRAASYAVTLILIELAAQLAENDANKDTITYRIVKDDEEKLPDDVIDSIAGWLLAPEKKNILRGRTLNQFHYDVYGETRNG